MSGMFPPVARLASGYDRSEVEVFFARARAAYEGAGAEAMTGHDVRSAAFGLVRHGYAPSAVDSALDRLESAFMQRERADFVAAHGEEMWMARVAERASSLYPRLVRPHGERFAPPEKRRGYLAADVDQLLDRLVDYFDVGERLTSAELRSATFRSASAGRAYAEGPVDAFLDRAIDVLASVE